MAMTTSWARLWGRVPTVVRASLIAMLILVVGQLPPSLFVLLGLRLTPTVPWFLAATALWLWWFWRRLRGHGWPSATQGLRARLLRARPLSPRLWAWALVAGGFGMAGVLGIALLTGMVMELPAEAYRAPFALDGYPAWTVAAFFFNLALVAGVVEEAAFRGYMLSLIERRHGWIPAIAVTALLFHLVHLSHVYATAAFVPFFAAYGLLHGMLVWTTRSILPSVALHVLGDFTILPIQYGVIADPLGASLLRHVMFVTGCSVASLLAFWKLRRVAFASFSRENGNPEASGSSRLS